MRLISFDWSRVWQWAAHLNEQPIPESARVQLQAILNTTPGIPPREHVGAGEARMPADLTHWLYLDSASLLLEVHTALRAGQPARMDPYADTILPGCAFAACRENDLPLAAALLELMLHWQMKLTAVHELADFLAFQQRPEGSCGYLNPLRPSPYTPEDTLLHFYLPSTYSIVHALAAYSVWADEEGAAHDPVA